MSCRVDNLTFEQHLRHMFQIIKTQLQHQIKLHLTSNEGLLS
jgi:hypothetical protein